MFFLLNQGQNYNIYIHEDDGAFIKVAPNSKLDVKSLNEANIVQKPNWMDKYSGKLLPYGTIGAFFALLALIVILLYKF